MNNDDHGQQIHGEANQQNSERDRVPVQIPENHRRVLAALLMQIAEVIRRYENWANDPLEDHLAFADRFDDLSNAERQALHDNARELVRVANALAEVLTLEAKQSTSVRASVAGAFTILWSDIEDSGPNALAGYGQVSPEERALLQPYITRLSQLSLRMATLVSGNVPTSGQGNHP